VVVIVSGLGRLVCCVVKGGEILEGLDEDLG
jgi:hypothetical protein